MVSPYKKHNPTIAAAMRSDLTCFRRGVMFAVLSIRQSIRNMPAELDDLETEGMSCRFLFGWKRDAYRYVMDYCDVLQRDILNARTMAARMDVALRVPGLGLVKAAFVLQLMGYDVACLDSRNVVREGRNPRAFRTDGKKSGPAFERKRDRYLAEVKGRSARYWNDWCKDVAQEYGMTAHEVSALHLCIIPDNHIPF